MISDIHKASVDVGRLLEIVLNPSAAKGTNWVPYCYIFPIRSAKFPTFLLSIWSNFMMFLSRLTPESIRIDSLLVLEFCVISGRLLCNTHINVKNTLKQRSPKALIFVFYDFSNAQTKMSNALCLKRGWIFQIRINQNNNIQNHYYSSLTNLA